LALFIFRKFTFLQWKNQGDEKSGSGATVLPAAMQLLTPPVAYYFPEHHNEKVVTGILAPPKGVLWSL